MKKPVSLLLLVLAIPGNVFAQDGYGFLNFVNMVPGDKSCEIRLESKNPSGDGLGSGDDTGWFMFPAGPATLTVTVGDLEGGKGTLQVKEGAGELIAIYLEESKKRNKDGSPKPPVLRIRSFPTIGADGLALRLVSLCPDPNRFHLGSTHVEVEQFEITEIPNWTGAGFHLRLNGKDIGKISTVREKEPFYLLAASDSDGNHTTALVYGGRVEVPPWRQKKKSETKKANP